MITIASLPYRLLEVIERGNLLNLWSIAIQALPLPALPAEPSPLTVHQLDDWQALRSLQRSFIASLTQWRPEWERDAPAHWGAILWSALLLGGLVQTRALAALARPVARDPEWHWVLLELWSERASGERFHHHQRWLPDPLTRLLLVGWSEAWPLRETETQPAVTSAVQGVKRLLWRWVKQSSMHLPPALQSIRRLLRAVQAEQATELPGFLNAYAFGQLDTTPLPEPVWQRLLHPPTTLRWTPFRSPTPPLEEEPEALTRSPLEAIDPDLTRLIAAVRPFIRSGDTAAAREAV